MQLRCIELLPIQVNEEHFKFYEMKKKGKGCISKCIIGYNDQRFSIIFPTVINLKKLLYTIKKKIFPNL